LTLVFPHSTFSKASLSQGRDTGMFTVVAWFGSTRLFHVLRTTNILEFMSVVPWRYLTTEGSWLNKICYFYGNNLVN
jgi:hypothetical protein